MATKLEVGGGGKALVAGPLKKEGFFAASLIILLVLNNLLIRISSVKWPREVLARFNFQFLNPHGTA